MLNLKFRVRDYDKGDVVGYEWLDTLPPESDITAWMYTMESEPGTPPKYGVVPPVRKTLVRELKAPIADKRLQQMYEGDLVILEHEDAVLIGWATVGFGLPYRPRVGWCVVTLFSALARQDMDIEEEYVVGNRIIDGNPDGLGALPLNSEWEIIGARDNLSTVIDKMTEMGMTKDAAVNLMTEAVEAHKHPTQLMIEEDTP